MFSTLLHRCRALRTRSSLLFSFAFVFAGFLSIGGHARARLQPYYVVAGVTADLLKPRFVFVLDTSSSMSTSSVDARCDANCEVADHPEESKMSVTRRALYEVVQATESRAEFALMTFDMWQPPTAVPGKCPHAGGDRRFKWVTEYDDFQNSPLDPIRLHGAYDGAWALCAGHIPNTSKRTKWPYPYLRWDGLGVGSVVTTNNQSGALPPSPLISEAQADFAHVDNADRKVQWFSRFLGVRIQLNDTTDPGETLLAQSAGDYGTAADMAGLRSGVKNHDFYYFPYVDGYPGYSVWKGFSPDPGYTFRAERMGSWSTNHERQGRLLVPLYLAPDVYNVATMAGDAGPLTHGESTSQVLSHVDTYIRGGVDPNAAATPWASTIGTLSGSPNYTNEPWTHTTVSSYLEAIRGAERGDSTCAPISVVLVTDGEPNPANTEGGPTLYTALADLRRTMGAKVYVLGAFFATTNLNAMACAGAGACTGACTDPCNDTPVHDWDTCADPSDPANACAYTANDVTSLIDALTRIIASDVELEAGASSTSLLNDRVGSDDDAIVQSDLRAYTEWPGWRGHVVRRACTDTDPANPGQLASHCRNADMFDAQELAEPTWGPCPRSRTWDAGECLRQTSWRDRRIYFHTAAGATRLVLDSSGEPTAAFQNELVRQGLIADDNLATRHARSVGRFMAGYGWPDGWKLPGLANSTPVLVRRIPPPNPAESPSVPLRDPHCAGKNVHLASGDLPTTLVQFAADADERMLNAPTPHREYQEAVLVGDDLGLLHAFHANSGNEMWAFIPSALLSNVVAQWQIGPERRGQPTELSAHRYGMGATPNQGIVWDEAASQWRHIAVIGLGPGGAHYFVFDVTHMSPSSSRRGVEVLWSTADVLAPQFAPYLGETWARPALVFQTTDSLSDPPKAYLVMGSGYSDDNGRDPRGRTVMLVDALSGAIIERADLTQPGLTRYDQQDFGALVDPAVASHCRSRFWAEMQEAYFVDPSGRIYRWDLGWQGTARAHEADSYGLWDPDADGVGVANVLGRPWSCQGAGQDCIVNTSTGRVRDAFYFAPAVSGLDRLDEPGTNATGTTLPARPDDFLLALISGTPYDDALDPDDGGAEYHSSLYLLVDRHEARPDRGLSVLPSWAKMSPNDIGTHKFYLRLALSDLTRTREFTPYPGATTLSETRRFHPTTRPIRSPRIQVVRAAAQVDGALEAVAGTEVFEITYFVHEPPSERCDARFYDATTGTWHTDVGSVYEIEFRLPVNDSRGFDFIYGTADANAFGNEGLTLVDVRQSTSGSCGDGVCGAVVPAFDSKPCQSALAALPDDPLQMAVPLQVSGVSGFTPSEPG